MESSLLQNIPDKRQDKNTTSHKFKQDLIEFFEPLKLKHCLEVGTNLGYSTYILSHLFEQVVSVDVDINALYRAQEFNKERSNITFLHGNFSAGIPLDWQIRYDVAFIDANHSYQNVRADTENCRLVGVPEMYIIYDDYGLPESEPAVKKAVDELLEREILTIVKYIGEPSGSEPRVGRPLVDWEGIICKTNDQV